MKNVNPTPYIPPELEIITFGCSDILTASGGDTSNGYVPDNNVDPEW